MTLDNRISVTFNHYEIEQINTALDVIEQTIQNKVVNLTPEEKQLYGKLGNNTDNWVNKVDSYMDQNPSLVPFYLKHDEFKKDQKELKLLPTDFFVISKKKMETTCDHNPAPSN